MIYYSFVFLIFPFLGIGFNGNLIMLIKGTIENNFTNRLKAHKVLPIG
jgi:hypothetical protein